jgi:hypothetical protein
VQQHHRGVKKSQIARLLEISLAIMLAGKHKSDFATENGLYVKYKLFKNPLTS